MTASPRRLHVRSPVPNSICLGSVSPSPCKVARHKSSLEQPIALNTSPPSSQLPQPRFACGLLRGWYDVCFFYDVREFSRKTGQQEENGNCSFQQCNWRNKGQASTSREREILSLILLILRIPRSQRWTARSPRAKWQGLHSGRFRSAPQSCGRHAREGSPRVGGQPLSLFRSGRGRPSRKGEPQPCRPGPEGRGGRTGRDAGSPLLPRTPAWGGGGFGQKPTDRFVGRCSRESPRVRCGQGREALPLPGESSTPPPRMFLAEALAAAKARWAEVNEEALEASTLPGQPLAEKAPGPTAPSGKDSTDAEMASGLQRRLTIRYENLATSLSNPYPTRPVIDLFV